MKSGSMSVWRSVVGEVVFVVSMLVTGLVWVGGVFRERLCGELSRLAGGVDFLGRRLGLTLCHSLSRGFEWVPAESLRNNTSSYSMSDASHRSGSWTLR